MSLIWPIFSIGKYVNIVQDLSPFYQRRDNYANKHWVIYGCNQGSHGKGVIILIAFGYHTHRYN